MIAMVIVTLVRMFLSPAVSLARPLEGKAPRVFFANHTSHLDFVVLWASLPAAVRRHTRPVAARDYWSGGVRRFLAERVFRAVLIERRHPCRAHNPVADMEAALDAGDSLVVFPEGTRGRGDVVQAFQAGLYHLLRERPWLEAVPVYLENLDRVLPKGCWLPVPLPVRVMFGGGIELEAQETRDAFLERARSVLARLAQRRN